MFYSDINAWLSIFGSGGEGVSRERVLSPSPDNSLRAVAAKVTVSTIAAISHSVLTPWRYLLVFVQEKNLPLAQQVKGWDNYLMIQIKKLQVGNKQHVQANQVKEHFILKRGVEVEAQRK